MNPQYRKRRRFIKASLAVPLLINLPWTIPTAKAISDSSFLVPDWGKDDGTLDHTLHESSEKYFYGLVRYDTDRRLVEIDPENDCTIGLARVKK